MADITQILQIDGRILLAIDEDIIELCVLDFGPIPDRVDHSLVHNVAIKMATENVDDSPYLQIPNIDFEPIPDRVDQSLVDSHLVNNVAIKTATENVDESPYFQIQNVK